MCGYRFFRWGLFLFCLAVSAVWAADKVLYVDVRNRPPDMVKNGDRHSGPLLEVIDRAAQKIGYRTVYVERRFELSLSLLQQKKGNIDIVPRVVWTSEREKQFDYLGPIGSNDIEILFLVKAGQEGTIRRFEDLEKLSVGTKAKTAYFERFDKNAAIRKIEAIDDDNLVQMFRAGRFDTMIVLDKPALEAALKKFGIGDYAYAQYRHPLRLDIYFGITKDHPERAALQKTLKEMGRSGEIFEIYRKAGVSLSTSR